MQPEIKKHTPTLKVWFLQSNRGQWCTPNWRFHLVTSLCMWVSLSRQVSQLGSLSFMHLKHINFNISKSLKPLNTELLRWKRIRSHLLLRFRCLNFLWVSRKGGPCSCQSDWSLAPAFDSRLTVCVKTPFSYFQGPVPLSVQWPVKGDKLRQKGSSPTCRVQIKKKNTHTEICRFQHKSLTLKIHKHRTNNYLLFTCQLLLK